MQRKAGLSSDKQDEKAEVARLGREGVARPSQARVVWKAKNAPLAKRPSPLRWLTVRAMQQSLGWLEP